MDGEDEVVVRDQEQEQVEHIETVEVNSQLEEVIELQQVSVAMVCVVIGLILAVSLVQIFKRYF